MTDLGDFGDSDGDDPDSSSDASGGEQVGSVAGNGCSTQADPVSETESAIAVSPADDDGVGADRDDRDDRDDSSTDVTGGAGTTDDGDDPQFDDYDADPVGDERSLGVVAVSQGLRVSEDSDRAVLRAFVIVGSRERVRLGKYLVVLYPDDELLFCRIVGLECAQESQVDDAVEIHARQVMCRPADEFEERDSKFTVELEPIAVLFSDDGDPKRRMVDRVPKLQAMVGETTDAAQIRTGLRIPEAGISLGHSSAGGERVRTAARSPIIDHRLNDGYTNGDPLVFCHTLVTGGTGSGKTHASKNILRQYLSEERSYEMDDSREVQTVVARLDLQDEYVQVHDDNPDMDDETARCYKREGIAYGGHGDTVALVPRMAGSSYPGTNHRAEQLKFTVPSSMARDFPQLVADSSLNDNQYPTLTELLNCFLRGYGDAGTYRQSLQYLDDPALEEELHGSGRVHEAIFDAIKRRVHGVPSGMFDQDARPITEFDHQLVRPGGLTVVPAYHLLSGQAKELFVLMVSVLLIDDKLSNDSSSDRTKETPLVLGMDEAHNFLADADPVQVQKVIQKFTEAAKQGRKERLGLFLITQDPQDIVDLVSKQVNIKVVLNLGDEDAIKSVNIPPNLEDKVPYMGKGQMVVYLPDNFDPVGLTGLSVCMTRHGD